MRFKKQLRPRERTQAAKVDSSHERGLSRQHFTNLPSLPHPPLTPSLPRQTHTLPLPRDCISWLPKNNSNKIVTSKKLTHLKYNRLNNQISIVKEKLRQRARTQEAKEDSSQERGLSRQHFTNLPSLPHPPLTPSLPRQTHTLPLPRDCISWLPKNNSNKIVTSKKLTHLKYNRLNK